MLYAFFDLDGTLISDKSVIEVHRYCLHQRHPLTAEYEFDKFSLRHARLVEEQVPRSEINAWFYRNQLAGVQVAEIAEMATRWLESRYSDEQFIKRPILELLDQHRIRGDGTVIVTGSFREIVAPLAAKLGVDTYLCSPLEEVEGRYTGALTGAPMIGEGKARAVAHFLAMRGGAAEDCSGYGDDHTDIPFLALLGRPSVLASGTPELLEHARRVGWPIVDS